ncbi:TIGR04157 family glycosyltransferase [Dysgonomonas sp. ZJ279]|uniref:TIGR04157 family glycosyltransferase n=1 Tax=Dysgonomonas sp. ZJ279 TaxID=2709796 RepID=UPI0013ECEACF|nr:TIGR04157 family glycosyltransferase [Dysgonomonas sp. ZJ279]
MKKKIYIFNEMSRAAKYGIGTYTEQLIKCLKIINVEFSIIQILSENEEVSIIEKDGYEEILIPAIYYFDKKGSEYYSKSIAYLLAEFIPKEKNTQYIFHLNFMTKPDLVINLRKIFKCKIILVAHYTNWSFSLLGDYEKLKKILLKKKSQLTKIEEKISKGVKADIKMINKSDWFVCVAKHTLNSFINIGNIDISKTSLINNALKDSYTDINQKQKREIRRKYCISDDLQIIIFVGRLDEVKGISYLIKAFKKVLKTDSKIHLIIVGEGNFNQYLAEAKNCWTKITFTGRLNKKQLYEFYNMSNIGIVSSIHEEFGFVAVEMMMHKLPIIVSNTGGLSEIIEDNISGLKVPIKTIKGKRTINVSVLAEKITTLLKNQNYAQELGLNARQRFLEKYELSVFKDKMLNLYQNI